MNTPVKVRLLQFVEKQGVSIRNFCKEISVSSSYFTKKGAVSSDVLEKIVHIYPKLNVEWVVTGRGKMLLETIVENAVQEPLEPYGIDYKEKYFTCLERSNQLLEENKRLTSKLQPVKL